MDELANRSHTANEKIGSGAQGSHGVVETKSSNSRTGNTNSFKRSLTEGDDEDNVTLSKGMIK